MFKATFKKIPIFCLSFILSTFFSGLVDFKKASSDSPFFLLEGIEIASAKASTKQSTIIHGAGASFPVPIYSKWINEYQKKHSDTKINYQSIGSGGGIRQLLNKTVDFGASDAPMKDSELQKSQSPILHIPTVLGAVVLIYNLPSFKEKLNLEPQLIADIFSGKIKEWNDPKLTRIHPSLKNIKNKNILTTYRSDGSGTTAVFTDYLSKVNSEWKQKIGKGKSIHWPVGIGAKGNEGVAGMVKQTPGAIGYVELTYAHTSKLPMANIKNSSGNFVQASVDSITEAARASLKSMPKDFRVSITNPEGKEAYPIASYTYLLVYSKMEKEKGRKLAQFILWALNEGQNLAPKLFYAPLPKELTQKIKKKLNKMNKLL